MKGFVVTACHNRKELTSQLANTLLMQTYKDVVFLLVDDGSTDGTISILEEFSKHEGYYCFHAGTKFEDGNIVTNGGRVLGVTAKGANLKEARKNAYAATEWVQFKNKYKRNDIGKAIDEAFSDGQ